MKSSKNIIESYLKKDDWRVNENSNAPLSFGAMNKYITAEVSKDYYEIPFHPYLEMMTDKWIECVLSFYSDGTFSIKFQNEYDAIINPDLWRKYSAHMRITDLDNTFSSRAEEELENVRGIYKNVFLSCGKDKLCESLKEVKNSAEKVDVNSWKSALYRALVRDCDEFCEWLYL